MLDMNIILANAKLFDGDLTKVPTMALSLVMGTVKDAKEVMIFITGAHKAFALYKATQEEVNYMWTVSAFQQHPCTVFVCNEDATLELKVKTVKYFTGSMLGRKLVRPLYSIKEKETEKSQFSKKPYSDCANLGVEYLFGTGRSFWELSLGGQNCISLIQCGYSR